MAMSPQEKAFQRKKDKISDLKRKKQNNTGQPTSLKPSFSFTKAVPRLKGETASEYINRKARLKANSKKTSVPKTFNKISSNVGKKIKDAQKYKKKENTKLLTSNVSKPKNLQGLKAGPTIVEQTKDNVMDWANTQYNDLRDYLSKTSNETPTKKEAEEVESIISSKLNNNNDSNKPTKRILDSISEAWDDLSSTLRKQQKRNRKIYDKSESDRKKREAARMANSNKPKVPEKPKVIVKPEVPEKPKVSVKPKVLKVEGVTESSQEKTPKVIAKSKKPTKEKAPYGTNLFGFALGDPDKPDEPDFFDESTSVDDLEQYDKDIADYNNKRKSLRKGGKVGKKKAGCRAGYGKAMRGY